MFGAILRMVGWGGGRGAKEGAHWSPKHCAHKQEIDFFDRVSTGEVTSRLTADTAEMVKLECMGGVSVRGDWRVQG